MTEKLLERIRGLTKAVDEQGCTPLHLAASLGRTSIVKLLLEHDRSAAYVKEKEEKKTALHFAAMKGHEDVMRRLISHCPDCCELVDEKGRNFLHIGIFAKKEISVVDFVLEDPWLSNILLNGKDDNGDTPLHYLADTCYDRTFSDSLVTDARVDKMTFNKANQNALDILLQITQIKGYSFYLTKQGQLKEKLKMNGVIPGCRHVRDKEEVPVENKEKEKSSGDSKVKETHLVVATLITTVSFAAGFTMPGGYQSDATSPNQGSAILTRNERFQAFVVANTIAMTLSTSSVLLQFCSLVFPNRLMLDESYLYLLTMVALMVMVFAFLSGTYAVLDPRLAKTVNLLGIILFYGLVEFVLCSQRVLMKATSGPFIWLATKMFYCIRKLYYKCLRPVSAPSKGKRSKPMVATRSTIDEMDRQIIV